MLLHLIRVAGMTLFAFRQQAIVNNCYGSAMSSLLMRVIIDISETMPMGKGCKIMHPTSNQVSYCLFFPLSKSESLSSCLGVLKYALKSLIPSHGSSLLAGN